MSAYDAWLTAPLYREAELDEKARQFCVSNCCQDTCVRCGTVGQLHHEDCGFREQIESDLAERDYITPDESQTYISTICVECSESEEMAARAI